MAPSATFRTVLCWLFGVSFVNGDLPVHCLHGHVQGEWTFHVGKWITEGKKDSYCGFEVPDSENHPNRPTQRPPLPSTSPFKEEFSFKIKMDAAGGEVLPSSDGSDVTVVPGLSISSNQQTGGSAFAYHDVSWTMVYDMALHVQVAAYSDSNAQSDLRQASFVAFFKYLTGSEGSTDTSSPPSAASIPFQEPSPSFGDASGSSFCFASMVGLADLEPAPGLPGGKFCWWGERSDTKGASSMSHNVVSFANLDLAYRIQQDYVEAALLKHWQFFSSDLLPHLSLKADPEDVGGVSLPRKETKNEMTIEALAKAVAANMGLITPQSNTHTVKIVHTHTVTNNFTTSMTTGVITPVSFLERKEREGDVKKTHQHNNRRKSSSVTSSLRRPSSASAVLHDSFAVRKPLRSLRSSETQMLHRLSTPNVLRAFFRFLRDLKKFRSHGRMAIVAPLLLVPAECEEKSKEGSCWESFHARALSEGEKTHFRNLYQKGGAESRGEGAKDSGAWQGRRQFRWFNNEEAKQRMRELFLAPERRAVSGLTEEELESRLAVIDEMGIVPRSVSQGACGSCYANAVSGMYSTRGYMHMIENPSEFSMEDLEAVVKPRARLSVFQGGWCNVLNQGCGGGYPFLHAKAIHDRGVAFRSCENAVRERLGFGNLEVDASDTETLTSMRSVCGALGGQIDEEIHPELSEGISRARDALKSALEKEKDKGGETDSLCRYRLWVTSFGYLQGQFGLMGNSAEEQIKERLYNEGPLLVSIEPHSSFTGGETRLGAPDIPAAFQTMVQPSGGLLDPFLFQKVDHSQLLVGWGEKNGVPVWYTQNSWGQSWGLKVLENADWSGGFSEIERGIDSLAIEASAVDAQVVIRKVGSGAMGKGEGLGFSSQIEKEEVWGRNPVLMQMAEDGILREDDGGRNKD
uniref:Peptidase C1A papain C-terminal domain-containing protein n=1 Tax=Chromera velia CCMP2878 TaxID=1169474 RepID=A0A0G4EZZ9_9ALVE|eukprot:Cvel_2538.t1-p1 / transcript=Cvel_2538.t1 / gene=Cvel_2538 / organism=Chromera_velia_CCMP2878 / gene_product=Probable cathepsin C, putative / transcript_product=Probable cathepsin C, putative / location=Cvel_scaffold100:56898-60846(+) / protein_length=914 / sequence_SO=supercontig / SO=protein_coding / is_pseudo=false